MSKRAKREKRRSLGLKKPLGKVNVETKMECQKCKGQGSSQKPWYNTLTGIIIVGLLVNQLSVIPGKVLEIVFQEEIESLAVIMKVMVLGIKLTLPTLTVQDWFLMKNRVQGHWTRFKNYLEQRG